MTINETIQQAATKFAVEVGAILRGGFVKTEAVVRAREWIVQQHPEMGHSELSRALGYRDHTSVINLRKRIRNSHNSRIDKKMKA